MFQKKISFLVAVHNEEKIIGKTLNHLSKIPYENYEVVIGLDGCDDKSEEIVKKFCGKNKKFRYYKLNLRQGKPAVIGAIIKKAKGEIIFINDADWMYVFGDLKGMEKLADVFNNPKIGGIAESFPLEWHQDRLKNSNLGYKIEAYSTYFWYDFQKKNFTYKKDGLRYVKNPKMFLTNIFRKKLYEENFSLGDDFERTINIFNKGYKIILFDDINMPRIKTIYNTIPLKDMFTQKIRTAIARKQLNKEKVMKLGIKDYYFFAVWHIFKNAWKSGIKIGMIITWWIIMTAIATFIAEFKKISTREGWKMRVRR